MIDSYRQQMVPRQPTVAELTTELKACREKLASWDRRKAELVVLLDKAVKAQRLYTQEIDRLDAERIAIEQSPRDGMWIDAFGQPQDGVAADLANRHGRLSDEIAHRQQQREAWLTAPEAMRQAYSHRTGQPYTWSVRRVPDLEAQQVHAARVHALVSHECNVLALALVEAKQREA